MLTDSYIILRDLRFHAFHGVEAQERLTGNDYLVTLRLQVNVSQAMVTDEVKDTVNYAEVYQLVDQEMKRHSNLLEHLAGRIALAVFNRWPVIRSGVFTVEKLNPPMGADCKGASVELRLINDKTIE